MIASVWCWMHWKLEDQLRGTTATNLPAPTVLPWTWSPSPRCYRELCPHYRGVTAVTAGKPWSPSPCSSLTGTCAPPRALQATASRCCIGRVRSCSPVLPRRRPCSNRSISPTCRAHSSKPAALCCSIRRMRPTDGRTPYRYIDPAPHIMRAVPQLSVNKLTKTI